MKSRGRSIVSIIVILYLILSGVCFESLGTDVFACPSDVCGEPVKISKGIFSNIKEDACTFDMLGSVQTNFLCQRTVTGNSEQTRKPETLSFALAETVTLCQSSHFFSSVDTLIFPANGELTEIIRFIHNKDGKKEL